MLSPVFWQMRPWWIRLFGGTYTECVGWPDKTGSSWLKTKPFKVFKNEMTSFNGVHRRCWIHPRGTHRLCVRASLSMVAQLSSNTLTQVFSLVCSQVPKHVSVFWLASTLITEQKNVLLFTCTAAAPLLWDRPVHMRQKGLLSYYFPKMFTSWIGCREAPMFWVIPSSMLIFTPEVITWSLPHFWCWDPPAVFRLVCL